MSEQDQEIIKSAIIEVLKTIYDPEIPVNIYELGLIYDVVLDAENNVQIIMTLTTPHCPVAQTFPMTVEDKVRTVEGTGDVHVEIVWDPPWTQEMMSEAAQLQLGFL